MFLRFIERKGWLTPPLPPGEGRGEGVQTRRASEAIGPQSSRNYLASLMQAVGIGKKSVYQSRLRPLFLQRLAVEGQQESPAIGNVPFLNGGLFEENELDKKAKDVPDSALSPMLGQAGAAGLFYRYNFTVEESTPIDIEVAVDPEMLGKVFERLVTGRHETGSYYTPKPIVSFMCREALKHYLATALGSGADRSTTPGSGVDCANDSPSRTKKTAIDSRPLPGGALRVTTAQVANPFQMATAIRSPA
jgi:hypothetical protein